MSDQRHPSTPEDGWTIMQGRSPLDGDEDDQKASARRTDELIRGDSNRDPSIDDSSDDSSESHYYSDGADVHHDDQELTRNHHHPQPAMVSISTPTSPETPSTKMTPPATTMPKSTPSPTTTSAKAVTKIEEIIARYETMNSSSTSPTYHHHHPPPPASSPSTLSPSMLTTKRLLPSPSSSSSTFSFNRPYSSHKPDQKTRVPGKSIVSKNEVEVGNSPRFNDTMDDDNHHHHRTSSTNSTYSNPLNSSNDSHHPNSINSIPIQPLDLNVNRHSAKSSTTPGDHHQFQPSTQSLSNRSRKRSSIGFSTSTDHDSSHDHSSDPFGHDLTQAPPVKWMNCLETPQINLDGSSSPLSSSLSLSFTLSASSSSLSPSPSFLSASSLSSSPRSPIDPTSSTPIKTFTRRDDSDPNQSSKVKCIRKGDVEDHRANLSSHRLGSPTISGDPSEMMMGHSKPRVEEESRAKKRSGRLVASGSNDQHEQEHVHDNHNPEYDGHPDAVDLQLGDDPTPKKKKTPGKLQPGWNDARVGSGGPSSSAESVDGDGIIGASKTRAPIDGLARPGLTSQSHPDGADRGIGTDGSNCSRRFNRTGRRSLSSSSSASSSSSSSSSFSSSSDPAHAPKNSNRSKLVGRIQPRPHPSPPQRLQRLQPAPRRLPPNSIHPHPACSPSNPNDHCSVNDGNGDYNDYNDYNDYDYDRQPLQAHNNNEDEGRLPAIIHPNQSARNTPQTRVEADHSRLVEIDRPDHNPHHPHPSSSASASSSPPPSPSPPRPLVAPEQDPHPLERRQGLQRPHDDDERLRWGSPFGEGEVGTPAAGSIDAENLKERNRQQPIITATKTSSKNNIDPSQTTSTLTTTTSTTSTTTITTTTSSSSSSSSSNSSTSSRAVTVQDHSPPKELQTSSISTSDQENTTITTTSNHHLLPLLTSTTSTSRSSTSASLTPTETPPSSSSSQLGPSEHQLKSNHHSYSLPSTPSHQSLSLEALEIWNSYSVISLSPKSVNHQSSSDEVRNPPLTNHHPSSLLPSSSYQSYESSSPQTTHATQHLNSDRQTLLKSRSDPTTLKLDGHQVQPDPNHPFPPLLDRPNRLQTYPTQLNENHDHLPLPPDSMEPTQSPESPTIHPSLVESSSSSSTPSLPSSSSHQVVSTLKPINQSSHSSPNPANNQSTSTSSLSSNPRQPCAKCGQSMTGQFVRALGTVYHLDCFRCQDCSKVVASKFFPVDGGGSDGKSQYPLCETDYFRRLGLICAKCGGALRGSYITALDMKFHVEHFTCSVCPTVFGPQDSYYEHSGQVYCHFHYSTRFAVKCTGCRTAILKQFVEINRNNMDEHWHPECYMINKFWNIKLAVATSTPKSTQALENDSSHHPDTNSDSNSNEPSSSAAVSTQPPKSSQTSALSSYSSEDWQRQEEHETAQSLKEKQKQMEEQVYRIWTVLSTFEESSAACISEMLRHVSSGLYLEGVRMAGKFVLHVETLFAAIDDLDVLFRHKSDQEISHVREARMLCKKIVNFFSLLSHTHETGARKMSITKELLSLVTGLAHYLKILIRIALTSALKLEREYADRNGILQFLSRLDRLARDPDASKATSIQTDRTGVSSSHNPNPSSTNGKLRAYGYKSLTRAVGTLFGKGEATTDLCEACKQTVEEECVRFGTSARWHTACLKCSTCHRSPTKSDPHSVNQTHLADDSIPSQLSPLQVKRFRLDAQTPREGVRPKPLHIYCEECAQMALRSPNATNMNLKEGFDSVTRLEQYAFLLCVALNKLYGLLKQRGILPASADDSRPTQPNGDERSLYDAYRNSSDIKRMKSVDLDRKLSTTARIPQRSTVVESPTGRVAQAASDSLQSNGVSQTASRPVDSALRQANSRSPNAPTRQPQDRARLNQTHGNRERDVTNYSRTEPPPRPPPTHLNLIPQANGINQSISSSIASSPIYGDFNKQQNTTDVRPPLSRNLTGVRIVDDQPGPNDLLGRDEPRLGSSTSPVARDTAGITLADLPRAMEAEQFREQQKPLPTQVATLSELSALESIIVKHVAALTLASESSAIKDDTSLDELLEIIEARKGNFWGKLFKGSNDKAKVKKKGVFGVPLDVLIERHGVDSLLGAGAGQLRVPSFVDDCISAMKQMDMSVEGVFRKNGNIRRLKELSDAIDRDDSNVNFSDDNAVQLAALLKKFLRDLPDPLLTFKLYHLFIASQRVENDTARRKTLHLICCLLPKAHRDTMEVLFVFLKWVASFSHVDEETGSKMDLQNLATVITPNILYARAKDPTRDESFLAIRAVHELLEFQDEFFQMPAEVHLIMQDQELLSSNMNEITSKDILKRVEALLKANNGKLKTGGKVGWEHYRGKGEILPHRPDLHASSLQPNDGSRAEHHPNPPQARTGVGMFMNIGPNHLNGYQSNPNLNGFPHPGPLTPSAGPSTPRHQQEFSFHSNANSNHPHSQTQHLQHHRGPGTESSYPSPAANHQRQSFHRDQLTHHVPPSHPQLSKMPSSSPIPSFNNPQTPSQRSQSPIPTFGNTHHQKTLHEHSNLNQSNNPNNSNSNSSINTSNNNRIPVGQRSTG